MTKYYNIGKECTRSTLCGDVKVFRTLDESPRHRLASLGNTKKKKCLLLFCIFAGGDFFLKWKGHFSFWCSAQKFLGRWRGEENSVTPRYARSTALTRTAFSILVLFARDFDFGMVRWGFGDI